jgi:hypothetical protein
MGSAKYPKVNAWDEFISKNGGSNNAWTEDFHTVYHFDIGSQHLNQALDMFAQFFISPLFSQSATERELNAVHSEHQRNITNLAWRLSASSKKLCNQQHAAMRFTTGDLYSLRDVPYKTNYDLRENLIEFHQKYYSSNIMTLLVGGNQPIAELEQQVLQTFALVPNRHAVLPIPTWLDTDADHTQFRQTLGTSAPAPTTAATTATEAEALPVPIPISAAQHEHEDYLDTLTAEQLEVMDDAAIYTHFTIDNTPQLHNPAQSTTSSPFPIIQQLFDSFQSMSKQYPTDPFNHRFKTTAESNSNATTLTTTSPSRPTSATPRPTLYPDELYRDLSMNRIFH